MLLYVVSAVDVDAVEEIDYATIGAESEEGAIVAARELAEIEGRNLIDFTARPLIDTQCAEAQKYFDRCFDYWLRAGNPPSVAMNKALWWDCAEVWNRDKSWNPGRVRFFNRWRSYKPYGEIPPAELVQSGNA